MCLAPPRGKCPEASQLYTASLTESLDDLLKDGIDDLLDISFVEMRTLNHQAPYQIGLEHGVPQSKGDSRNMDPTMDPSAAGLAMIGHYGLARKRANIPEITDT